MFGVRNASKPSRAETSRPSNNTSGPPKRSRTIAPSCKKLFSQICFLPTCDLLPLSSFGGAPYSLDETSVVKCVVKAGCSPGGPPQIADQISIDLSHIDRRAHVAIRDRGFVRYREWDVRSQRGVPRVDAVGVITGEAEPCLRSSDFEAGATILRCYTNVNLGREYGTRLRLSANDEVIGNFTSTLLTGVRQFDSGPENLGWASISMIGPRTASITSRVCPPLTVSRLAPEDVLLK
jgi:hypothetical protein